MRSLIVLLFIASLAVIPANAAPDAAVLPTVAMQPGDSMTVTCPSTLGGSSQSAQQATVTCAAVAPTATPVPPTPTPGPPPAGSSPWHPPGAHDGLNVHEHGDAPPAWVLASGQQPFTQSRESHVGYKGVFAADRDGRGTQSYLITHILSTEAARSHGDHDFQVWFRSPTGSQVLFTEGVLDFGNPPVERTNDTGERPIFLSDNDGGCETWYNRPGSTAMDLGWTICGRYQKFSGQITGGAGTFRTMDWVTYSTRIPPGPLRDACFPGGGVCRLSYIVNSKDYQNGSVVPIN